MTRDDIKAKLLAALQDNDEYEIDLYCLKVLDDSARESNSKNDPSTAERLLEIVGELIGVE